MTPEELSRREAELERKLSHYGYELSDFDDVQLQRVLKLGRATFEIEEDGRHKVVYIDLVNNKAGIEKGGQTLDEFDNENDELEDEL